VVEDWMRKTYVYYDIPHITHDLIDRVKACMSFEEIKEMERRSNDILGCMFLEGYKDRLLAKDIFEKAYIVGLIEIKKFDEKD
jgi:hypothetical protein